MMDAMEHETPGGHAGNRSLVFKENLADEMAVSDMLMDEIVDQMAATPGADIPPSANHKREPSESTPPPPNDIEMGDAKEADPLYFETTPKPVSISPGSIPKSVSPKLQLLDNSTDNFDIIGGVSTAGGPDSDDDHARAKSESPASPESEMQ